MVHEVRRDQQAVLFQNPVYLPQRILRVQNNVQSVCDNDRVKRIVPVGKMFRICHLKGEIIGAAASGSVR